jgi:hypothetical protein
MNNSELQVKLFGIKRAYLSTLIKEGREIIDYSKIFIKTIDFVEENHEMYSSGLSLNQLRKNTNGLLIHSKYDRLIELSSEVENIDYSTNYDFLHDEKYIELDNIITEIVVDLRLFYQKNHRESELFCEKIRERDDKTKYINATFFTRKTHDFCQLLYKTLLEKLDDIEDSLVGKEYYKRRVRAYAIQAVCAVAITCYLTWKAPFFTATVLSILWFF